MLTATLLLALAASVAAQRVTMEQQTTELLMRARADVFTVCNGRKPNSCYHEKRDELKALETFYTAECEGFGSNAVRVQGTVLFRFCDELYDLFNDRTDDIDENVLVFDVVESARRRYAMICADYLSPRRCHDELGDELQQAEDAFQKYCEDLIVPKTFLTSENTPAQAQIKARDARRECKVRVTNVFDRRWEIASVGAGDTALAPNSTIQAGERLVGGDDATYDLFNRRVIAWTAQLEVQRLCGHIPRSACSSHASTSAAWTAARSKFRGFCALQLGTSRGPIGNIPSVAVTATSSAGTMRNNYYFGFLESDLCTADVNAIFNGNLTEAADVPFYAYFEHVSDLLQAARGVYAEKCGALEARDCKQHYEEIERSLHGKDALDTDQLSDLKHVFRDACEALPAFTSTPATTPATVNVTRNEAREHACKNAVTDIFSGSDDDDDDVPTSYEEIFTNARLRYATICNDVVPFTAAKCYEMHRAQLHAAMAIVKDHCDDLSDDDDDSSSSSSSSSSSGSSSSGSSSSSSSSSSGLSSSSSDEDFESNCHRIVGHIFDDVEDVKVNEKLSLLTVEEVANWARFRYNVLCGYEDSCHNKKELREERSRMYKKCEQAHLTASEQSSCKTLIHDIFDDKKEVRGQFRSVIMQVARTFYYEVCGFPNGFTAASTPSHATCNVNTPQVAVQLKRARDHVQRHLCGNLDNKVDESQCDAAVYQVFDNLFDNQINGYNPTTSTVVGTSSSDLLEFEEFSVVLRQWANLKSDVICGSTSPAPLAGAYYNMIHVCRRASTPAWGRLMTIGIAKCMKLINDYTRNECVAAIKNIYDNQNDAAEDGGRYVQDFAIVKPAFNAYYNA